MGHYDDCYEGDAERSTLKDTKWNIQNVNMAEDSLDELTNFIEALRIEKPHQDHLLQKVVELRAMIRFLGK
jgi:hypothetical protein